MNIYIIIENANRELLYKTFLAKLLVYKGHKVILGEKNEFRNKLNYLPAGLILEKGVVKNSINRFKKWKLVGHKIFCLDEESLTYNNDKQYFGIKCDEGIENIIDLFFVTSKRHYKTLIKRFNKNKLVIVGMPRFEVLKKPFRNYFYKKVAKIKNKYGEYILICSRFGNVNFNHIKKVNQPKLIYGDHLQVSKKIFNQFSKIPNALSNVYPDTKIIVRPHPSENKDIWKKIISKNKNCEVIYDDDLYPWLIGSKFVIHNRCTTGLEAYMLDKEVISYDPYHNKYALKPLFSCLGKNFTKISQINKNNLKQKNNFNKKIFTNKIKYYLENVGKKNSFKHILKEIEKISKNKFKKNKKINISFSLKDKLINLKNTYFPVKNGFKKYSLQKVGKFNIIKINEILSTTNFYFKKNKKIKTEQIGKKIFLIEV